jgi:hypothetical protein
MTSAIIKDLLDGHGGLVNRGDLARRWGISGARVRVITRREDFPAPIGQVQREPIYLADECDRWRQAQLQEQPLAQRWADMAA